MDVEESCEDIRRLRLSTRVAVLVDEVEVARRMYDAAVKKLTAQALIEMEREVDELHREEAEDDRDRLLASAR